MAFRPVIPGGPRYVQPQGLDFSPLERGIDSGIRRNALLEQRAIDEKRYADEQEYKNQLLKIKQAEAARGGLPWWAGQDGSVHPAMIAKLKATPNMGFAPIVIDGALVNRSTGATIREAPKSPVDRMIEQRMRQSGGSVQPQSAPGGSPAQPFQNAVTPTFAAPQQDPNLIPANQPGQAAPAAPPASVLDMDQDTVTLMQGSKTYGPLGKAIAERQAARDAGVTFAKPTINDLQSDTLAKTNLLVNLRKIDDTFRPEYQTYFTKANMEYLRQLDRLQMTTPEQQQQLADFAEYRQNAYQNLNEYIKAITGAAMTNAEAGRITKGMVNPGEGFFDGDSPAEARRKIDNAIQGTELALARLRYLQNMGRMPKTAEEAASIISLNGMKNKIMKETQRKARGFLQQGMDQGTAIRRAEEAVRQEYGI